MTPTTILSRPKILATLDSARINLNLAKDRYLKGRVSAQSDYETALVYTISAREALDRAIADLKSVNLESEAVNG